MCLPLLVGCALPASDGLFNKVSRASGDPFLVKQAASKASTSAVRRLPAIVPPTASPIHLASHAQSSSSKRVVAFAFESEDQPTAPVEIVEADLEDRHYTIDLSNALALGGASHWQIQLAREQVLEAQSHLREAQVLWLPSLRLGLGYFRHDGQLQETEGNVLQAGRNSLFVGGGAGLGEKSLPGGSAGPARLGVNLSLADAYFEPIAARRRLQAAGAGASMTLNDSLLEIAEAYYDLVESHGMLANSMTGLEAATEMRELVELFAREGGGSQAEADRARTEETRAKIAAEDARRKTRLASAELIRLLRLDSSLDVVPVEDQMAPVMLVDEQMPREALIAQGLTSRPEMAKYQAIVCEALARLQQEIWRPWLPNLQAGATGGTFGGGPSGTFENQKGRGDLELLAVWELRNLGIGNQAIRGQRASQLRQRETEARGVRDQIISEILAAASDVASFREQIEISLAGTESASDSYRRSFQKIREGEGLPLELLQAIRARTEAQDAYTSAVSHYNRAQARLLRALGQPPGVLAE